MPRSPAAPPAAPRARTRPGAAAARLVSPPGFVAEITRGPHARTPPGAAAARLVSPPGFVAEITRKAEVVATLPPRTRDAFDDFHACAGCGHVYWRGAHWAGLTGIVEAFAAKP